MDEDLTYPTSEADVADDIELYLKLLEYDKSFRLKDLWWDRKPLYKPRLNEDSYVSLCRDIMIEEGLIRLVEKNDFESNNIFKITTKGLKVKKIGWTKYSKSWDRWFEKIPDRNYKIATIALAFLSFGLSLYSFYTNGRIGELKKELQEYKLKVDTISTTTDSLVYILTPPKKLDSQTADSTTTEKK
jgi:hypothetical protein